MTASYPIHKNIFYLIVFFMLVGCSTVTVAGLKPIYPQPVRGDSGGDFFEVDSLQPTFRWESFPRPQDLRKDENGLLGRFQNVTYDLKIWRAQASFSPKASTTRQTFPEPSHKLIYYRQGLAEPVHKIEKPLAPLTRYIWSVRARFEVDGGTRVIPWAAIWRSRIAQRSSVVPHHPTYYRFKTPPLTIWVWN